MENNATVSMPTPNIMTCATIKAQAAEARACFCSLVYVHGSKTMEPSQEIKFLNNKGLMSWYVHRSSNFDLGTPPPGLESNITERLRAHSMETAIAVAIQWALSRS